MKRILLFFLLCIALTASAKVYKYETVDGDPMKARIYTLDNGLKVYISANSIEPRVTAYIAVNTGSRNDPADCTGLAHYLEHLMFKGSKKFGTTDYETEKTYIQTISNLYEDYRKLTDPEERRMKYHEIDSVSQISAQFNIPNEYDKMMAALSSNGSNAYTSNDITCYVEDIPSNEIERWAEIQSDRFRNLVLRGFHTELEAVYEEKNMSMVRDSEKLFEALMAKLYPCHSYGTQTTIGTQEHLKNPSLAEIQKYYDKYYKPNNVAICMSGDLDYDRTIAIIDANFGSWQPGNDTAPRSFPKQPMFTEPQDTAVYGQEKETLMLGWRFDGARSIQCDTLALIEQILGNGVCGLIDLDINQKMAMLEAECGVLGLKDYSSFILVGSPKEGQSLPEVRSLLLNEIAKLKGGEWDEALLPAIVNNLKFNYLRNLDDNGSRVGRMVDAFINGVVWKDEVGRIERLSKISKNDVISFANKYFNDNYVCCYKLKGEDKNIKKVEKPEITPIPSNRDKSSTFLDDIVNRSVEPIQPKFVDFQTDMTTAELPIGKERIKLMYVPNTSNDLYTIVYRYDFGDRADVRYSVVDDFASLLGTSKLTSEEIKKQFYALACEFNVNVGTETTEIILSGLKENMPKALQLIEHYIGDIQPDQDVYNLFVENVIKERNEAKTNQNVCMQRLWQYALHGPKNDHTNIVPEEELRNTNPQVFTDLLKGLKNMKHSVLYYGPLTVKELSAVLKKVHKTSKKLLDVPQNKEWEWTHTPTNEVIIAPYEANNIIMRMLSNEHQSIDIAAEPTVQLFNNYFGGSMNAIVFQELRETRGLAYNASAYYYTPSRKQDPQYWMQHIITQNDKLKDCVTTFELITDSMPQTPSAFDIAKQSLMKEIAATRTTKMNIIRRYLKAQKLGIDYDLNKSVYDALPSLSMQDIVNFERKNIAGKPLHYVILGNEKELDMEYLNQLAPIRRVTLEEIFGY